MADIDDIHHGNGPDKEVRKFGNKSFLLSTPGGEATSVRLYTCETTSFKGSSEQIINAVMGNDFESCVGLSEPAEGSNKHLLVVSTLIKTCKAVPRR